ncbi:hypothetical protein GQ457_13G003700 [Hibiscus cannabinus]
MNIEERVAKLEQGQQDLKACLDIVKQSIPDQIAQLQEATVAQLIALLEKRDGPVSSWPSSVDRVKTPIFPTARMEECRPVSSWPSSVDRDRFRLGLRQLIGSRHQSSRPQGWRSAVLSSQKQDNFLTFSELQDRFRLGLRRLIGSRHQSSRPQGWRSVVLSSQKQDNFLTFSELQDRFRLGLRRLIGSRHQSSRPQGWRSAVLSSQKQDNFLTFSELQDRFRLGLRPVSSWPSSVDRVKTPIFPTSRMEECRQISQTQGHLSDPPGERRLIGLVRTSKETDSNKTGSPDKKRAFGLCHALVFTRADKEGQL